jgi:hypothetical protein
VPSLPVPVSRPPTRLHRVETGMLAAAMPGFLIGAPVWRPPSIRSGFVEFVSDR